MNTDETQRGIAATKRCSGASMKRSYNIGKTLSKMHDF